jgi:hypothetical protein
VGGSLPRYGQADLAAESCKARIVLVAQDEGVVEDVLDARIAIAPRAIEPLEGLLRIVALRVYLGDPVGSGVRILLNQGP